MLNIFKDFCSKSKDIFQLKERQKMSLKKCVIKNSRNLFFFLSPNINTKNRIKNYE